MILRVIQENIALAKTILPVSMTNATFVSECNSFLYRPKKHHSISMLLLISGF